MSPFQLLLLLLLLSTTTTTTTTTTTATEEILPFFREAPAFRNSIDCNPKTANPPPTIHISMTLDLRYLRGSIAAVFSLLRHSACPENLFFHFISAHLRPYLRRTILSTFPYLHFHLYSFDPSSVKTKISSSIRPALDQPLNYARIYLAELLPPEVTRVLYLDSDLIVVDDVSKLWGIHLGDRLLGAPEYCQANFTNYFTNRFWAGADFTAAFKGRRPCYFNTGVMVIDLGRWREGGYTVKLEKWMRIQKRFRIYELGSLPPFLLVFAGEVERVEHRWNQHGLGGDNLEGRCRDLHPGPVSLLHWSGKGKPWLRLDSRRPCPLDRLWAPYDLLRGPAFLYD